MTATRSTGAPALTPRPRRAGRDGAAALRGAGPGLRARLGLLAVAGALLLAGGCAGTSSESADAARRRDLVVVPQDARPVERLAWREVRSIQPLNRRMILMNARRPYLLVLENACPHLRPESLVLVENAGTFTPRVDVLWVVDPYSDFGRGLGLTGVGGIGMLGTGPARTNLQTGANMCRPDTLYAIRDEDITWLRDSLSR